MKNDPLYSVYVIRLDPAAARDRRKQFAKRNPAVNIMTAPLVYVGQTSRSPQERMERHFSGQKAASIVRDYGMGLMPELTFLLPPLRTRAQALEAEKKTAERLQTLGFAVWWG